MRRWLTFQKVKRDKNLQLRTAEYSVRKSKVINCLLAGTGRKRGNTFFSQQDFLYGKSAGPFANSNL